MRRIDYSSPYCRTIRYLSREAASAAARYLEAPIKLRRFRLRRFKAIAALELGLSDDLLLLIGQNGAGKSSLLQALSFIRYFGEGRADSFFKDRGWEPLDLRHRLKVSNPTVLGIDLLFEGPGGVQHFWQFEWGLRSGRTLSERIWTRDGHGYRKIAHFARDKGLTIGEEDPAFGKLRLNGSMLSFLDLDSFGDDTPVAEALLAWSSGVTSLELLSPNAMRGSVRGTASDIGARGDRLAGFLSGLSERQQSEIVERLSRYYPINGIDTVRKRAGWIDMKIAEVVTGLSVSVDHVSDGFLRLLALASIPALGDAATLILLDEIEDGIEPHILPKVLEDLRRESPAQFVVTTHSPVLLNHVEPHCAALLHRDAQGRSEAVPLDDLSTFATGEDIFGPGELWLNTSLPALQRQARTAVEEPTTQALITSARIEAFAAK